MKKNHMILTGWFLTFLLAPVFSRADDAATRPANTGVAPAAEINDEKLKNQGVEPPPIPERRDPPGEQFKKRGKRTDKKSETPVRKNKARKKVSLDSLGKRNKDPL